VLYPTGGVQKCRGETELTYVKQQLGDAIVGESEQLQSPLRNPRLKEGMIRRISIAKVGKAEIKHAGAPFADLDFDDTGGSGVLAGLRLVVEHVRRRLNLRPRHPLLLSSLPPPPSKVLSSCNSRRCPRRGLLARRRNDVAPPRALARRTSSHSARFSGLLRAVFFIRF
jgi:hypothetical protein